jgi:xanthine/CO dehydrogenase XdhC/CoxF family maturation factor
MWLSTGAALALARLAFRYGVTQREFVENMLLAEDERVLSTMSTDTPEWDMYFGRKPISVTP